MILLTLIINCNEEVTYPGSSLVSSSSSRSLRSSSSLFFSLCSLFLRVSEPSPLVTPIVVPSFSSSDNCASASFLSFSSSHINIRQRLINKLKKEKREQKIIPSSSGLPRFLFFLLSGENLFLSLLHKPSTSCCPVTNTKIPKLNY